MTCGRQIRCWDNTVRPCVRSLQHTGSCNPFSDTDYSPQAQKAQKKESVSDLYKKMIDLAEAS